MVQIYKRGLLKSVKMFPGANDDWILQEDNYPKYESFVSVRPGNKKMASQQ